MFIFLENLLTIYRFFNVAANCTVSTADALDIVNGFVVTGTSNLVFIFKTFFFTIVDILVSCYSLTYTKEST